MASTDGVARQRWGGFRKVAVSILSVAIAGCHSTTPPPTPAAPVRTVPPVATAPSTRPAAAAVALPTSRPTTAPASLDSKPVAVVNGLTITRQDLFEPMVEAYGLVTLQNIMLLKLAQQVVANEHLQVTPADVQAERQQMMKGLFPDAQPSDDEGLLDQMLKQQNITRPQFEMALQTNACLRKVIAGHVPTFTDEALRSAFGRFYGENRQISDIEVANMRDVAEVKRRLDAGEPFGKVASEMSDDKRTAGVGGQLPSFSAQSPSMPQAIKDAAFSMQPGKVSDVIQDGTAYHVIQLNRIIPPKVVKFEDVKQNVLQTLQDSWTRLAIRQLRDELSQRAIQTIHIDDPELRAQWQQRLDQQQNRSHDKDMLRDQLNRMHTPASTAPATAP